MTLEINIEQITQDGDGVKYSIKHNRDFSDIDELFSDFLGLLSCMGYHHNTIIDAVYRINEEVNPLVDQSMDSE